MLPLTIAARLEFPVRIDSPSLEAVCGRPEFCAMEPLPSQIGTRETVTGNPDDVCP